MNHRSLFLGLALAAGLAVPGAALADDNDDGFVRGIIAQQFFAPWLDRGDDGPRRQVHRGWRDDDDDDDRRWRHRSHDDDDDDDDDRDDD